LEYTDTELSSITQKGKALGLDNKTIEDMIFVGSRESKRINSDELMAQMGNWSKTIKQRGFPYRFESLDDFKKFNQDLTNGLNKAGISADDVAIQGSSLRTPKANDVDISVFVDEAKFDKLLVDRFDNRITISATKTKVKLTGKSHEELVQIAEDISKNPKKYNAQARTFKNAIKNGIVSSKSDISKPLKKVSKDMQKAYPDQNIESVSVLVRGGKFDIKPEISTKGR
jgi:hypothetical protein